MRGASRIGVSPLCRGHANLLCIIPTEHGCCQSRTSVAVVSRPHTGSADGLESQGEHL